MGLPPSKSKLGNRSSSKDLDGGFNKRSGTRSADTPKMESKWEGTEKGKTKHTFRG